MNFTPFGTAFSTNSLQTNTNASVHQLTTAGTKFSTHNVATAATGQVLGVLSSDDGGVTYLRPVDANGFTVNLAQQQPVGNSQQHNQIITLPIQVPGAKPGDLPQQQTLQIQVVNPSNLGGDNKLHAVPVSLQHFQQGTATVLTVAYSNPDGGEAIQLQLHQPELESESHEHHGQPHSNHNNNNKSSNNNNSSSSSSSVLTATNATSIPTDELLPDVKPILTDQHGASAYPVAVVVPPEIIIRTQADLDADKTKEKDSRSGDDYNTQQWQNVAAGSQIAEYLSRVGTTSLPMSLQHFLKFSADTIKREALIESSPLSNPPDEESQISEFIVGNNSGIPENNQLKKKRKKYKKKPPKPKKPRPGQVHIATALDGTTLFCCPECNMAYSDKDMLEQHLVAHKIERRFICDICGAGLKRREHLERHRLGHNPERPFVCSICCKGFKRKEHLNLHFVIHSGEKTEVCPECGKGFYRRDHLRKHARSHLTKRIKDEYNQQQLAQQRAQQEAQLSMDVQQQQLHLQQQAIVGAGEHSITVHHSVESQTTINAINQHAQEMDSKEALVAIIQQQQQQHQVQQQHQQQQTQQQVQQQHQQQQTQQQQVQHQHQQQQTQQQQVQQQQQTQQQQVQQQQQTQQQQVQQQQVQQQQQQQQVQQEQQVQHQQQQVPQQLQLPSQQQQQQVQQQHQQVQQQQQTQPMSQQQDQRQTISIVNQQNTNSNDVIDALSDGQAHAVVRKCLKIDAENQLTSSELQNSDDSGPVLQIMENV